MRENGKNFDLIDKYFNNELSDTEKADFESRLSNDEELGAEFEQHQLAHRVTNYAIAKNLKNQLMELEAEQSGRIIPFFARRKSMRITVLSLAATVLLVIGFFFINNLGNDLSQNELALNYYEQPDLATRNQGGTPVYPENLETGIKALKEKNYVSAINTLSNITKDNEYYVQAQYMLGHAYFQKENHAASEAAFEQVIQGNDIRYKEEAEWYGLLACLSQEQNCSEKLQAIIDIPSHTYHEKALTIDNALR